MNKSLKDIWIVDESIINDGWFDQCYYQIIGFTIRYEDGSEFYAQLLSPYNMEIGFEIDWDKVPNPKHIVGIGQKVAKWDKPFIDEEFSEVFSLFRYLFNVFKQKA